MGTFAFNNWLTSAGSSNLCSSCRSDQEEFHTIPLDEAVSFHQYSGISGVNCCFEVKPQHVKRAKVRTLTEPLHEALLLLWFLFYALGLGPVASCSC